MKGILNKTKQGWIVIYDQILGDGIVKRNQNALPLHRDDISDILSNPDSKIENLVGKEVEFEVVKEYIDSHTNQVQKYAKLINHSVEPKETLYTEEQVRKAISKAFDYHYTNGLLSEVALLDIIQSLKQSK